MKRIFTLALLGVCLFTFSGCTRKASEPMQAHFTAEVLNVYDTNILARVTDKGNSGVTLSCEAYIGKPEGCPEIEKGDIIKVYFNGNVMETYPLQLGKVYSIEVTGKAAAPDWGVKLTAENITPSGLTIVCEQSGGAFTGELMTGSYFVVEVKMGDKWEELPIIIENLGWTEEAWLIPMENTVKWNVDWDWLYGELPAGQYRIGKEIMNFRGTADYDKAIHYAEFSIG